MTFCPREKLIGQTTIISHGNAGREKGVAAAPRHAYRARTTVIMGGPAALANDYSNPDGPRLPNPTLAEPLVPSRGISLEKQFGRTRVSTVRRTSCRIYAGLL